MYPQIPYCTGQLSECLAQYLQGKTKDKFTKLQHKNKTTDLARENQREKSKICVARARTVYKILCDKLEGCGPHVEARGQADMQGSL